jgi:hypothetical protein
MKYANLKVALAVSTLAMAFGCGDNEELTLGPQCSIYLGEDGCCFQAAGDNSAARQECHLIAKAYKAAPEQAEASCKAANETAIATGLCDLPGGSAKRPSGACAKYLECAAVADPQAFPAALAAYGAGGQCWSTPSTSSSCDAACSKSLDLLRQSHPSEPKCNGCSSGADCGGRTPYCDPSEHVCVECHEPSHCKTNLCFNSQCASCNNKPCAGLTYCDTNSGHCRPGCSSNSQCKSDQFCNLSTHTCVTNNSGRICDFTNSCTQGDVCLLQSMSKGMCLAACAKVGDICPTADAKYKSICLLQYSYSSNWYCLYLCEYQGLTFPCPDPSNQICQTSTTPGIKVCQPK